MSKELFLLSSNKARRCKLEMITRLLRWGSKISFYRTTELSVPKSRQVIAHAPPRLLLLKWKFPKLCMHIHTVPVQTSLWGGEGTDARPWLPPPSCSSWAAALTKRGVWGLQHKLSLPRVKGSTSAQPPSSPRLLGGLAGTAAPGRWDVPPQGCTPRVLHPIWVRFCSTSSDPA